MQKNLCVIAIKSFALLATIGTSHIATAQNAATLYAKMSPLSEYLMADHGTEITLARSGAPESISRDAEVLVLGPHGFETAVKGSNGFVCIVGRGWSSATDPDFWNPKVRVPMCVKAAAAHTYLLRVGRITDLALAGRSPTEVNAAIIAAVASNELPPMETGAMCYMMSKDGYGGDVIPHWPSHVTFFYSDVDPAVWGANQPGSPVLGVGDPSERLTQFVVPVRLWSDGTATGHNPKQHHHH